jgi:hypothetical protein
MPEGLIEPFAPDQIRDLFAYLTSREPPPVARGASK